MSDFAGNNQQVPRDDSQAIESLEQDLALAREKRDTQKEIKLLIKLGSIYYSGSDYDQALKIYQESFIKAQEITDHQLRALSLLGLGWVYQRIEAENGKFEKMLECHHQCLAIAEEISDSWLIASVNVSLGRTYHVLGNNDKAISYSQQGLAVAKQIHASSLEEAASETLKMVDEALGKQQPMVEYQDVIPSGELVLSQIGLDATSLKLRKISPQLRAQYQAVINWLTKYKPVQDASNLEKIRGYLEACYHLFQLQAWEDAIAVFSTRLNPTVNQELHAKLGTWGYY